MFAGKRENVPLTDVHASDTAPARSLPNGSPSIRVPSNKHDQSAVSARVSLRLLVDVKEAFEEKPSGPGRHHLTCRAVPVPKAAIIKPFQAAPLLAGPKTRDTWARRRFLELQKS